MLYEVITEAEREHRPADVDDEHAERDAYSRDRES